VTRRVWAIVTAGCVLGGLAWADVPQRLLGNKPDLEVQLETWKVVRQADGQESLENAQRAFPGEVIQYDAHYVNQSDHILGRVSPMLPIPEGMVMVPDSARPAPQEASLDGKTFESIPVKRRVTMPGGEIVEETVAPSEYRALRWHVGDMAAGKSTTVSVRTQVLGNDLP